MLIQFDTVRHELFVKSDDGSTIEVTQWWAEGPYGHLRDGETEEAHDWCTATRYGDYVMVKDPAIIGPGGRRKGRSRPRARRTR